MIATVWNNGVVDGLAVTVSGILLAVAGYVLNKNREFYAEIREMMGVLVTVTPTMLNPRPKMGLIDLVDEVRSAVSQLALKVQELAASVEDLTRPSEH